MNLRKITEPFTAGVLVAAALVAGAFAVIGFTWRGTARLLAPVLQIPYMISGGLFALALLGLGLAVLRVQMDRLHDAQQRQAFDGMVRDAAELIPLMRARRAERAKPQARQRAGRSTSRVSE